MLEFAFVAFGFYFLLAGTIALGAALSSTQTLQNATRLAARELAVLPMPPSMTFESRWGSSHR